MDSENTNNNNELNETTTTQLDEEKKKYLYLYAEFDTFKKRVIKERLELIKFGCEPIVRELLGVVDNLERALEHTHENTQNTDALVTGIKMVKQQLIETLLKFGIQIIVTDGEKFDPEKHEAVGHETVDNPEHNGGIIKEFQKGYTLHGRLLRPAKVSVGVIKIVNDDEKKTVTKADSHPY